MKKALLLHGWEGNSESNWFPWLKSELENKGYIVFVPNLPDSHSPVLKKHLATIENIAKDFGENDYIIGHSMGAKLAMHYIEENNLGKINGILVGPTYDTIEDEIDLDDPIDVKKNLIEYNSAKLDFNLINKNQNKFSILLSTNDKFIRIESAKNYYSQLNTVEFREFENYGHFMKSDGFEEFKEILDYIK